MDVARPSDLGVIESVLAEGVWQGRPALGLGVAQVFLPEGLSSFCALLTTPPELFKNKQWDQLLGARRLSPAGD